MSTKRCEESRNVTRLGISHGVEPAPARNRDRCNDWANGQSMCNIGFFVAYPGYPRRQGRAFGRLSDAAVVVDEMGEASQIRLGPARRMRKYFHGDKAKPPPMQRQHGRGESVLLQDKGGQWSCARGQGAEMPCHPRAAPWILTGPYVTGMVGGDCVTQPQVSARRRPSLQFRQGLLRATTGGAGPIPPAGLRCCAHISTLAPASYAATAQQRAIPGVINTRRSPPRQIASGCLFACAFLYRVAFCSRRSSLARVGRTPTLSGVLLLIQARPPILTPHLPFSSTALPSPSP